MSLGSLNSEDAVSARARSAGGDRGEAVGVETNVSHPDEEAATLSRAVCRRASVRPPRELSGLGRAGLFPSLRRWPCSRLARASLEPVDTRLCWDKCSRSTSAGSLAS